MTDNKPKATSPPPPPKKVTLEDLSDDLRSRIETAINTEQLTTVISSLGAQRQADNTATLKKMGGYLSQSAREITQRLDAFDDRLDRDLRFFQDNTTIVLNTLSETVRGVRADVDRIEPLTTQNRQNIALQSERLDTTRREMDELRNLVKEMNSKILQLMDEKEIVRRAEMAVIQQEQARQAAQIAQHSTWIDLHKRWEAALFGLFGKLRSNWKLAALIGLLAGGALTVADLAGLFNIR